MKARGKRNPILRAPLPPGQTGPMPWASRPFWPGRRLSQSLSVAPRGHNIPGLPRRLRLDKDRGRNTRNTTKESCRRSSCNCVCPPADTQSADSVVSTAGPISRPAGRGGTRGVGSTTPWTSAKP